MLECKKKEKENPKLFKTTSEKFINYSKRENLAKYWSQIGQPIGIKPNTPAEDTIRPTLFSSHNDRKLKPVAIIKPSSVQHPYVQLDPSDSGGIMIPAAPTTISIAFVASRTYSAPHYGDASYDYARRNFHHY